MTPWVILKWGHDDKGFAGEPRLLGSANVKWCVRRRGVWLSWIPVLFSSPFCKNIFELSMHIIPLRQCGWEPPSLEQHSPPARIDSSQNVFLLDFPTLYSSQLYYSFNKEQENSGWGKADSWCKKKIKITYSRYFIYIWGIHTHI